MSLIIRLATLSDVDSLCAIEQQSFAPSLYHLTSRRQFRYLINKGNAEIWLAELHGQACGMAVLFFKANSRFVRLYSIAVLPAFQGRDVGLALFECAQKQGLHKKLMGLSLEIRSDNKKHYDRYRALGYKDVGTVEDYYPDHSPCIKLQKIFI